jgi:hypothetical protein
MSGQPSWAMTDESLVSIAEWTMDWGKGFRDRG